MGLAGVPSSEIVSNIHANWPLILQLFVGNGKTPPDSLLARGLVREEDGGEPRSYEESEVWGIRGY